MKVAFQVFLAVAGVLLSLETANINPMEVVADISLDLIYELATER